MTVDSLASNADDGADDEIIEVGWHEGEPVQPESAETVEEDFAQEVSDEPADAGELGVDDDRYSLDGVEPRPAAQKAVMLVVVLLIVLVALYVLDYWGIVSTGFSGLF